MSNTDTLNDTLSNADIRTGSGRSRRSWSGRGLPRAVVAILLATGLMAGLAACSSTVVRDGGRPGSSAKYGATTIVQRGDTLYRIATRNGIAYRDLAAWNGIQPPYTIYPGQRLRLYPGSGGDPGGRVTRGPVRPAPSTSPAARPSSAAPASSPAIASDIDWRWPAEGQLISRFQAGQPTMQGIDIAGTAGAPVRAAGEGVVVYSGNGLVGYGELIIIKHNDHWLSAYGHNRSRLVAEGESVQAGQKIAELGRTGAPRDMLHFEIRYNGKPVDPLRYLPQR